MHKPGYKETNIMKKKKSKKKIIIGAAAVLVVAGGVTVAGQRNSEIKAYKRDSICHVSRIP